MFFYTVPAQPTGLDTAKGQVIEVPQDGPARVELSIWWTPLAKHLWGGESLWFVVAGTSWATHFLFYRQLHFSSQPGVANGIWENEAENCLVVA